jgi:GNAT superfamily N-acetyltransferase
MAKIRLAFITDIDKLIEVADATWKQTYASILSAEQIEYMYGRMYSADALREQMQNGVTFLMCFEDGHILGFAAYEFRTDAIFIPKLYVKPDAQARGVGKALLFQIEKIGQKNNCRYIELNVHRKNKAMYFYKRLGFELHEKADIAYGKFWLNDYVLRKKLCVHISRLLEQ